MRKFSVYATATLALLAAGCHRADPGTDAAGQIDEDTFNDLTVRTAFEQQAHGAVVAEQSIYRHHFEPGGASLNELGERQVDILAAGSGSV